MMWNRSSFFFPLPLCLFTHLREFKSVRHTDNSAYSHKKKIIKALRLVQKVDTTQLKRARADGEKNVYDWGEKKRPSVENWSVWTVLYRWFFCQWKELLMTSVWKVQNKMVPISDLRWVLPARVFMSLIQRAANLQEPLTEATSRSIGMFFIFF